MRSQQARDLLDNWTMLLQGKGASTKRVEPTPNPEGRSGKYWLENSGTSPGWNTERTVAYLAAYVEIGGASFPGEGIPLDDGYMYPDRAVIRTLLQGRFLAMSGGMLRLTEKGEALIAPMLRVDNGRVRRGHMAPDNRNGR